jgi:hypothetical protein
VTEHSIEENILAKAKQKRNLDILVMDKGKFDASVLFGHEKNARATSDADDMKDVFSKGGLRAILGVDGDNEQAGRESLDKEGEVTAEQMEKTMASLEDADDVQALRGVQKEAAEELREFDESVEIKKNSESDDEDSEERKNDAPQDGAEKTEVVDQEKQKEEELQKEFASWQDRQMDPNSIEAALSATERYALRFREDVDPFYSIFAVTEYRRKMEAEAEGGGDADIDIDEIEREKALEELYAIEDGDLLVTHPRPEALIRQRTLYQKERARLRANKKRRKLTGEDWEQRLDALSNNPFWYNIDTGEGTKVYNCLRVVYMYIYRLLLLFPIQAIWDKPTALLEIEAYETAYERLFVAMPIEPLVHVMRFLSPFPDRMQCATVCKQWRKAACHFSFVRHVYPVEMGAYTIDESKMHPGHYRTISDALSVALHGDTIELADGHYWLNEDLIVDYPVKIVGDEGNPANVVVEVGGTIHWRAPGGWCEGVTFRRSKMASEESAKRDLFRLENNGKIDIINSVLDNEGSVGNAVYASGPGSKGRWENVVVKGSGSGVALDDEASLDLGKVQIRTGGTVRAVR